MAQLAHTWRRLPIKLKCGSSKDDSQNRDVVVVWPRQPTILEHCKSLALIMGAPP